MSVRVHELARRCGLSNKEMIDKLRAINYPVKSHSSTVDNITAESIQQEFGYVEPVPAPPAPEPAPAISPSPTPEPAAVTLPVPAQPEPPAPAPVAAPTPQPFIAPVAPPISPAPVPQPVITPRPTVVVAPPAQPSPPPAPAAKITPPPPVARPVPPLVQPPKPVMPQQQPRPPQPAQVSRPATVPIPPPRRPFAPPQRPSRPGMPAPAPAAAQPAPPGFTVNEQGQRVIQMKPPVVVRDLAQRMGIKAHLLLMQLMELNVFASINETLTEDVARKVCERQGFLFDMERRERGAGITHPPLKKVETLEEEDRPEDMLHRAPVVTVMGHVDHGKTSLLDAIRKTNVAAGESGGITQHIGASLVELADGKVITFLDTPGHQAFTQMRARGANLTDIAVLVVAADDGLMPQTIEAINHAKAAGVPMVIAINKCDLPAANPDRVRRQLQDKGITAETWGGDTIMVEVSATTGKGIPELLEMILLQAEIMELKASPKRNAKGNVIEAQMEPGMGPTATVLVRKGTLHVGDAILIGPNWGRIRALIDDKGKRVKQAGPGHAVKVVGLSGLPDAGAEFIVEKDEKSTRALAEERQLAERMRSAEPARQVTLQDMLAQISETQKRKFRIVLKADVQGSLEALKESLTKVNTEETDLEIIHSAVGTITENDVLLASASKAVIIGFRVKTESGVTDAAKREGVAIKLYSVIYELLDQIEQSLEGLAKPETTETILGHAEIKQVFELSKGAMVAGCVVTDGRIARSGRVRVLRRDDAQFEGRLSSLRHFQNDVREVKAGQECGLRLENFSGYQAGDVIECYVVEKAAAPV